MVCLYLQAKRQMFKLAHFSTSGSSQAISSNSQLLALMDSLTAAASEGHRVGGFLEARLHEMPCSSAALLCGRNECSQRSWHDLVDMYNGLLDRTFAWFAKPCCLTVPVDAAACVRFLHFCANAFCLEVLLPCVCMQHACMYGSLLSYC